MFDQQDLFTSGAEGYHTFRIPAIIVTRTGAVLAFCEGRRLSASDTGEIDLLVRRSEDDGETWSETQLVWHDNANTCGNPCPVVDAETGIIHLLLTWNRGDDDENSIEEESSKDTRRVFATTSDDHGRTWSEPQEITSDTKRPHWRWYATGPGVGLEIRSGPHRGRLVVPCDHSDHSGAGHPFRSHVIISDDRGKTWSLGGALAGKTDECQAVELAGGTLLLNMRSNHAEGCRAIATSADGGMTWSDISFDRTLIETPCQASILRYDEERILFSNPASDQARVNMTVRLSEDDCRSWPIARTIHAGPSAYSCLAALPDGRIACLYERGDENPYERITLARFDLDWLTDGQNQ